MILSYWATDSEQEQIDRVITHQGAWHNPEEDLYVMHSVTKETVTLFGLLGVEYWLHEDNQSV